MAQTKNLKLTLTPDSEASSTTFKTWRNAINGEADSNMLNIDAFAGTTNAALTNKVDKETGKGLSTNDFTNEDKAKVDAIPADPKYTDTTYTAGEGIFIDDTNTIYADITATGNNNFTGANTFNGKVVVTTAPTADNDVATKKYVDDHADGGSATIGNVTATATSIDSSKPATATATTSGNDISFAFGIPKGATGPQGPSGKDGKNGTNGITPTIGTNGNWYLGTTDTGKPSRGDKGDTGAQGIRGEKGDKGDTGAQGIQGEKGDKGEKGDTGAQGIRGEKGDKGDKGDTGAQGIQGEKGATGPQGPAGKDGTQIKSVSADATTLSYYEYATASVDFTNGNMHFTFGIPEGEPYFEPCLIEGTPINMADGTTKLIENIKQGDLVQSYNPVTGENTPAVVLLAYITGHEHKFTSYSFSNGKHLTIYGMHGIYNKRTGITKDIRNINKNDQIVSISGDTVQWITSSEFMFVGEKKARYNIVTSNNLYYANGILLGQKPFSKMQLVNDFNIPLSDEIREVWQQDVDDYNSYSSFLNDPNYHAEVSEAYNKLTKAEHHIKVNKQRLFDSDYWVQKFTEGVLSLTEWTEAKAKRAAWRKEVNDNEVLRDESKAAVDAIINKYRNGKTPKSIFESCCARDNEIYETCKNYFEVK